MPWEHEMYDPDLLQLPAGPAAGLRLVGNLTTSPTVSSLYVMTYPGRRHKVLPVDMTGQPWRAIFIPDPSLGQLRSSGQTQLDFSLCPYPISSLLWLHKCWSQGHLCIKHLNTQISSSQSASQRTILQKVSKKTVQYFRRIFIWIYSKCCPYNIFKLPNKC